MLKTLTLATTRVVSSYLVARVVGNIVEEYTPDLDSEDMEIMTNKEKIKVTLLHLGGLLAVALITDYVTSQLTNQVERTFWPE